MFGSELYQVNRTFVVSDLIEDEVIIVNLKTGNYYSLAGVGAQIWSGLEGGIGVAAMIPALAAAYNAPQAEIAGEVQRLVAELAAENLIVPVSSDETLVQSASSAFPFPTSSDGKREFAAPVLNKYTDMHELLLVDPVHDVDEQGWPILKNNRQ